MPTSPLSWRRGHHWLTFGVLSLSTLTYAVLQNLVVPVLPQLAARYDASATDVAWVLTAFLLSAAVATPIVGRVGDVVGKERALVGVMLVLALGTTAAALVHSLPLLVLARVVQGVGGASFPLAFGIIRDEFPPHLRHVGIGMVSGLLAIGGGFALVLAGPIVEHLGLAWLFWFPTASALLAALATALLVPRSPHRGGGRPSVLPGVLLAAWLVALLLGISQGRGWGWLSGRVLGLLAGTAVLVPLWIRSELRSPRPVVDMRMMRRRGVWTANLVALLFGVAMYAAFALLPQLLQTPASTGYGIGLSLSQAGVWLLPQSLAFGVTGAVYGPLDDRFGARSLVVAGGLLGAVAFAQLAVWHAAAWQVAAGGVLLSLGFGTAFSAMANLVVAAVPAEQTGVAAGMNANLRTVGGSFGTTVAATLLAGGVAAGALPRESGYVHALVTMGVVALAAGAVGLLVPRRSAPSHLAGSPHPALERAAETGTVTVAAAPVSP